MPLTFAAPADAALPLHVLEPDAVEGWAAQQPTRVQAWLSASGFSGGLGSALMIPGDDGAPAMALAGYGSAAARARQCVALAGAVAQPAASPKGKAPAKARTWTAATSWAPVWSRRMSWTCRPWT